MDRHDSEWIAIVLAIVGIMMVIISASFVIFRDSNNPNTIKNADHQLIKTYTKEDRAMYVYKLTWSNSSDVEYSAVSYKNVKLDDGTHGYKVSSVKYYNIEPVPDHASSYKMKVITTDDSNKQSSNNDNTPVVMPYMYPWYPYTLPIYQR